MSSLPLLRIAMAGAGFMLAHQVAAKAVRDAIFLSALPVTDLPKMVIVAALVSVAAVPVYSRLMAWLGPTRLVPLGFGVSAVAHLAEWWLHDDGAWVAVVVYLHIAGFGALLLSGFWSLASELFDAHAAKRQFALITGAGALGGILGGLTIERVAAWTTADTPLLALALFHATCAAIAVPLGRAIVGSRAPIAPETLDVKQIVRASPYVRDIAAIVALGTASAAIIDYLLKVHVVETFVAEGALIQFFALFYTATQVLAFLFQTSVVSRAQTRIGVGRSVTSLPLGVGVGGAAALLFPTLTFFTLARGMEAVLRASVFRSGYELLFTPIAPEEKRRVKSFLDVACDRAGDAAGAGVVQLLLLTGTSFLVSELLGLTLLMAALSLWIGGRLEGRYLQAVERRLVQHAGGEMDDILPSLEASALRSLEAPAVRRAETRVEPPDRATAARATAARATAARATAVTLGALAPVVEPSAPPPAPRPADPMIDTLEVLRSGQRERILEALEQISDFDAVLVAQVVRLLAWDDVAVPARHALERVAERHVGLLVDTLLDGASDFAIRRRIPRVLLSVPSQRSLDGLVAGLHDHRFEVRYQCSRAMDRVLIAEPALRVDARHVYATVERELSVARPIWSGHRLLDAIESSDALMFLDEHLRDRANRSLEHVFSLLVAVLPREPLKVAFRAIHSDDRMLRGLAFEYLSGVLPERVWTKLWAAMGEGGAAASPTVRPEEALASLLKSQGQWVVDLARAATPSDGGARGQSDPPPTATRRSDRR